MPRRQPRRSAGRAAPARSSPPGTSRGAGARLSRAARSARLMRGAATRTRGSTPGPRHRACRSGGTAAQALALPRISGPLGLVGHGDRRDLLLVRRLLAGLPPAAGAELGVGRERVAAVLAGHNRLAAHRPATIRAEVGAPRHGSTAFARPRRPPGAGYRREHRVELVQPLLECDHLAAALDQQVVAEGRATVHLEREPAETADSLLAG